MTGVPTSARALARARLAHNLLAIRKTAYKDLRRLAAEIGAVGDDLNREQMAKAVSVLPSVARCGYRTTFCAR